MGAVLDWDWSWRERRSIVAGVGGGAMGLRARGRLDQD